MNDAPNIAHLISEARRRRGLTQSELARQIDCKQSAISMFECGHENALARPKVDAALKLLGLERPRETEHASPAGIPSTPFSGHRYCPVYDCPSNIPFTVQSTLRVKPLPQAQPSIHAKHCAFCGELLENKCPECGCAVNPGACCIQCGAPYISIPPSTDEGRIMAWVEAQHARLQSLGLLPL